MMKSQLGKRVVSFLAVLMIAFSLFAFSDVVQATGCEFYDAADPLGTDCAAATGLTDQDPRIVVGRLIQVVLGLVGIIMVSLFVWAGFQWMTAAGREDQIESAKKTLIAAVIGLVIILTSYAITNFVTDQLLIATGR